MAAFALVALLLYQQRATRHMIANIHADAPAVGFALLSLLPLIRCGAAPGRLRLALSAFFAVCAVGSKQVELPLLVAVPAWLWAASGRRAALLWSAHVVGLGLAVGAAFAAWFGLSPLWFNTIEVPRHHPWIAFGLGRGLLHLIDHSMVNGLLGVTLALVVALKRAPGASWRAWLGQQPWTLVAALAVASSTTGVLSLAKVGGDINGFHTVYYLAVTCGLLLAGAATSTAESPLPPATARWVLCMLLLLLVVPVAGREIMSLPEAEQGLARRAALFRFVRGHPRQVYAPWDPLTTLLAEGRLYHFDYGVTDRRLAGLPPTPAHYRAQLPEDLRWVVIQDRDPPPAEAERYLRIGAPVVTSLEGHVVRPVGAAW
jgi:hypothetical protein